MNMVYVCICCIRLTWLQPRPVKASLAFEAAFLERGKSFQSSFLWIRQKLSFHLAKEGQGHPGEEHGPLREIWRQKHHEVGLLFYKQAWQLGWGGRHHEYRAVDEDSERKPQGGSREPDPGGAMGQSAGQRSETYWWLRLGMNHFGWCGFCLFWLC